MREAIRDLLWANNGVAVDRARATAALDAAALRAQLAVRFRGTGMAVFEAGDPAGNALANLLSPVAALLGTDAWARLKACRLETCGWAFYDSARNRSRAWCSMEVCGNRAKARAYRSRRRLAP